MKQKSSPLLGVKLSLIISRTYDTRHDTAVRKIYYVSGSVRPNGATQNEPVPIFDVTLILQRCGGQSEQVELEIGLFGKKNVQNCWFWCIGLRLPGFVDLLLH